MSDDLLSLGELAKRLRVSDATIRSMVRSGKLQPTIALSSHTKRFDLEDVRRQLTPPKPTPSTPSRAPAPAALAS